ncbi:CPBP family intramembrane metalloprotease [Halobacteriales archaeon QS_5_70_17]|nr:MAG: CPBP family intramembrane metalloprotease [Halobacteriales archaeon QS_5_70_17]
MSEWAAFAGLTAAVLLSLLALARASQTAVVESDAHEGGGDDGVGGSAPEAGADADATASANREPGSDASDGLADRSAGTPPGRPAGPTGRVDPTVPDRVGEGGTPAGATADEGDVAPGPEMTTAGLLVNVALSQGLLGAVLLGGAWYTRIPPAALGVDLGDPLSTGPPALAVGVGLGTALYLLSAAGAAGAAAFGMEHDETLREMLLPDAPGGWALLLLAVLPVIAGFEELLFRAAVIGATSAGFPVSPWLLAVVSSVAFALGHGAQGRAGIVVTGSLGFVLAVAFVLTNSTLAVVVAHYLVNALEFVVSGHFGIEWGEA